MYDTPALTMQHTWQLIQSKMVTETDTFVQLTGKKEVRAPGGSPLSGLQVP